MNDVLIDTNILVYMHDPSDRARHARSVQVVDRLAREGVAVLSVQCLTEFYRAVRWKIPEPLTADQARLEADRYARNCKVLPLTTTAALDGMRASGQYTMSCWDALIWAVAKEEGVPYVLSEDFGDGQTIEGVHFVNPFSEPFDIDALLA